MDRIDLDLEVCAIVGILPRERIEPQPMRISLRMELPLEPCGTTGELGAGVDYAEMDSRIRYLAVHGRFRLIESLAMAILRVVLDPPRAGEGRAAVERATVTIRKPAVLRAAEPSVTLSRDASWAGGDAVVDLPEVTVAFEPAPSHGHPVGSASVLTVRAHLGSSARSG